VIQKFLPTLYAEMPTPKEKFQKLLRELFQFDCADLDFGIYRIMNHKRAVIEQFIEKDLLNAVSEELQKGALAQEAHAAERLAELSAQIKDTLGADSLDAEGNLSPNYAATKIGKEYLSLQQSAGQAKNQTELESPIFNHLFAFFSRYYDQGDFLSLRRYSKREKYAIPYNGEEVYLHWANSDQYYIKTGENFTDYSYKHGNWIVRFKLRNADVEQNNVKGAKRFFIPEVDALDLDVANHELTLPFEYRPLVSEEEARFGRTNIQESLIANAVPHILAAAKSDTDALSALAHERRRDAENNPVSLLEHHLRTYTQKNTRDFFIHKDLKGFLERELDFYLKNEVLNLDEMESGGEQRSECWFQILRVISNLGRKIIAFVSQIEEFQKRIFEKIKFIAEVNYCVTLDRVPENLYPQILTNKGQIEEWKQLFSIEDISGNLVMRPYSESLDTRFLRDHNKLIVDTRFFDQNFKDELLASFEQIDDFTNGLLVHSENLQALRLLNATYSEQVKSVYIDPPYNTGSSSIPYKNSYRHSSWGSMMHDRLHALRPLITSDGVVFVSIDKTERTVLELVLDKTFLSDNRVEELVWAMNTTNSQVPNYSTNHEYVEVYAKDKRIAEQDPSMFREPKPGYAEVVELIAKLEPEYPPISEIESELRLLFERHTIEFREFIEALGLEWENEKGNDPWKGLFNYSHAEYRDPHGKLVHERDAKTKRATIWVWQEGDASMPATKQAASTHNPTHRNWRFYKPIHPITKKPCPHPKSGWKFAYDDDEDSPEKRSFVSLDRDARIAWGPDESKVPRLKRMLHEVETNIAKSVFQDYSDGEKQTSAMFGISGIFLAPKHSDFVARFISHGARMDSIILDSFGGSGSTAHAVIDLNRRDYGSRKYLVIEVAEYFDTVLKPRVLKAAYSASWRNGKPVAHGSGVSQLIKYITLESYEDALNNIAFNAHEQQPLLQLSDYVLEYMLHFETKDSETFLNVSKLDSPFDYKVHRHGKDEPLSVDLPETFNYLIGLHVRTRSVYENNGTRYLVYRGKSKERETVIIWRTTRAWGQKEFETDREFIEKEKLTEGAEDIFVNTDSFVPGAHSLDPVFKRLMFNEE
jgi:adenine-specific DNA-methyltransferase